ncbi:cupin domain-containing protein [Amycolatopsis solani]|uniref:cupin domain-containing protein n=1 Tax=Amycolatopsis solani TaxID=3028615 RepID=UPI0025B1A248|nr:cupin domain-containing protein [Amycolatopsis sp. MEP2-6]
MNAFPLPGGIGVSHLRAYDWAAEDGVCGGSPHLHLACTEAYVVTGGRGAVQTLSVGGYDETPLEAGVIAWFAPGTVHRMVQVEDLRVTVLMQNSGLPEAGDAVFTFPPDVLADPVAYAGAAALPKTDHAARQRRDLAIRGYLPLREALRDGDPGPLRVFHRAALSLVSPKIGNWVSRWRTGALRAAELTGVHLAALAGGDGSHLEQSGVRVAAPSNPDGYGMCGRRAEYDIDEEGRQ